MWEVKVKINNNPTTLIVVSRFCQATNKKVVLEKNVIEDYKWVEINDELLTYDIMQGLKPTIIKLVEDYKSISNKSEI